MFFSPFNPAHYITNILFAVINLLLEFYIFLFVPFDPAHFIMNVLLIVVYVINLYLDIYMFFFFVLFNPTHYTMNILLCKDGLKIAYDLSHQRVSFFISFTHSILALYTLWNY